MKKLREEDGVETEDDDDESKWEGWDVETDSSDSSDEEDWINVDSDDNDIVVTDSEGEEKPTEESSKAEPSQPLRISTLATSKVVWIFLVDDNLSNTHSRSSLQQILPCSMNYGSKKRPKL
jgi:protein SDA1